MTIEERKRMLRIEVKQAVSDLSRQYCERANRAIFQHVISLPAYEQAQTIFCFVGTEDEVDTIPIIKDALAKGKTVGVPKCIAKGIMEVYRLDSLECLSAGRYGILEPQSGAAVMAPEELELVLVPCLTCSRSGYRLGYGGGYYDRYLVQTRARRAVLCRSKIMREDIPMDAYDQTMDYVISEDGVVKLIL